MSKIIKKELLLNDLQESKIYVRNNISYMPPKEIINPFLDKLDFDPETDQVSIQIQNAVINQEIGGAENIAYPRFLVELKRQLLTFGDVEYQNTFGLLIGMDQQKPLVKVYTGMNVSACTNLCIFNAEHVHAQNLMEPLDNTWNAVEAFAKGEELKIDEYRKTHLELVNTVLNQEQVNERLGYLLRLAGDTRLGTTPIVTAAKLLSSKQSLYYFEKETTMYNLYNSITQSITDSKDLLHRPDKTLGLTNLLLN